MLMRRRYFLGTVLILGLLASLPFVWRAVVERVYGRYMYTVDDVPAGDVAVVFGAAVYGNGRLSSVLRDRVDTAVALYQSGKVQRLIMTGGSTPFYDEPGAMMQYAMDRGVPKEAIVLDYGGHRTYDSCYQAKFTYGQETAVLVTQAFHLPRAIFTCRALGVQAVGVVADLRPYRAADWYEVRETAASFVALIDVIRRQPPVGDE